MHLFFSISAISIGACAGALLRWFLSIVLNPLCGLFPLGTLAVNLSGSLLMGLGMGFFAAFPAAAAEYRLMFVTGFLGSLTTFSTFAGEAATMLQEGRYAVCGLVVCLNVFGSIGLVFAGLLLAHFFRT